MSVVANINRSHDDMRKLSQKSTLEDSASAVMSELQQACAMLLDAMPCGIHRPVHLEKALKLDKKLAWQIFRLGRSEHALSESANVPSPTSVRRLLHAAELTQLPTPILERVVAAFEYFETFVSEHGGDRTEILSMMSGLSTEGNEDAQLKIRKAAFKSSVNVWGIQLDTCVRTCVVCPTAAAPSKEGDGLMIRGYNGLQRLRASARLVLPTFLLHEHVIYDDRAPGEAPDSPMELNTRVKRPSEEMSRLALLPRFSTRPLPNLIERSNETSAETELEFPTSGRAGAIRLYTVQGAKSYSFPNTNGWLMIQSVVYPTAVMVVEFLIPQGWSDPRSASVEIYGRCGMSPPIECRAADLLPQRERVTIFSDIEPSQPVAGAPVHVEAIRSVLDDTGLLKQRFDLYRTTIQYPIMQSVVRLRVDSVK